ncbi:hypothetical protein M0D21_09485 [Aquimarina sp. D1M17]|uniref:hypothetical protein n=1 Tax=Aquimarina acroporae TaxID=2937283 RepID=UPI0020C01DF2|nr:hypothetical protein [Aquimarina acroporae]MCK8521803.1 hypothetical protein [Aquimarina acroporae]
MNKTTFLIASGISMALAGAVMIFSKDIGIGTSKVLLPILFLISGIATFLFAGANKQLKNASFFHKIQSVLFIVFAVVIAFLPDSLMSYLLYVTYFSLCYGLIEIMTGFSVLNAKGPIKMNMLVYRFISGLVNSIGAMILLLTALSNELAGLQVAGLLSVVGGLFTILFANKVKKIAENSAVI